MFVLRCVGVSLSFFLLLYCGLSLAVMRGWRIARRACANLPAQRLSNVLFGLRSLPFAAASFVTLIFVVPSFLLLEPRVVAEPIGEIPLSLGIVCLFLLGAGVMNAVAAQRRTVRAVNGWMQGATTDSNCYPVPLFRIRPSAPALAVAGGLSPRMFLSDAAAAVLNGQELETALKHEIAHVQRRDNLKKLLFRFCALPGMSGLENAWSDAAEMSADDAAVSSSRQALDLASALIKLSRFASAQPNTVLAIGLAQARGSALNTRIERLVAWDETRIAQQSPTPLRFRTPALLVTLICLTATYGGVLKDMHKMTEWLVR
ncbi:MAG TPA: M56 family metallopeptidase [Terriglobales bacterium]|nr:M56 family metallopeptidase [Terriglobales bacterium]